MSHGGRIFAHRRQERTQQHAALRRAARELGGGIRAGPQVRLRRLSHDKTRCVERRADLIALVGERYAGAGIVADGIEYRAHLGHECREQTTRGVRGQREDQRVAVERHAARGAQAEARAPRLHRRDADAESRDRGGEREERRGDFRHSLLETLEAARQVGAGRVDAEQAGGVARIQDIELAAVPQQRLLHALGDQAIGDAQLARQRGDLGLGRDEALRAAFHHPAGRWMVGQHDAAGAALALQHGDVRARADQIVRGGQAGETGADHDDLHAPCTSSTTRCRCSTGVSGRTPWPRLKMWPARPAARASTSRTLPSSTGSGARQATGSRLP